MFHVRSCNLIPAEGLLTHLSTFEKHVTVALEVVTGGSWSQAQLFCQALPRSFAALDPIVGAEIKFW